MDELFIVEPTPAELELRKLRAVQVLVDGVIGQVIFHWKEKERKEREEEERAKGSVPEDPSLLDTLREHIQGPLRQDLEQAQVLYAKENPEKQPFKFKYEARELFHKHERWFKDWLGKHGVAEGKVCLWPAPASSIFSLVSSNQHTHTHTRHTPLSL
eukprot:TRINITY_DN1090_c0_g1_i1.p1 TRINITY_DN1090_c0_g1~~TRINITY_DN1090_c0_g1_i1.p1  ORF type:complete len:157 (+),score=22.43 TRINITY_DN1090_c0_g1_i1:147-617(+)